MAALVVTGQHGSLLLGRDGAGVQVHEREFLALAARALDLGAELQGALVHTGIVGELYVLREIASVLLVDDRVVLVDFRTLEIFGGTGNLATVEYDHGSYFDNGFRVEILNRERNIDVSGNDTVVQRQNLGVTVRLMSSRFLAIFLKQLQLENTSAAATSTTLNFIRFFIIG